MALKDTWQDLEDAIQGLPDSGDEVSAEPINNIARSVIAIENQLAQGEIAGKPPYIGENGNWYVWNSATNRYEDSGVSAQGGSGLPKVIINPDTEAEFSFPAYTEMRFSNPVSRLGINDFLKNIENPNIDMWALTFTLTNSDDGEAPTVWFPNNIEWAVGEPTFTAGYTYYLSFVPFGEKILGIWVAKELAA